MSEQTKHTPGPWKVSVMMATDDMIVRDGGGAWVHSSRRIEAASGALICEVTSDSWIEGANSGYPLVRSRAEMLANAALIAAAPEMLEALKTMVKIGDLHYGMATGEKGGPAIQKARAAIAKAEGVAE